MNETKKTVLFFQEAWGRGGIETFVMNTIRTLGSDKYSFEIWSAYDWYNGFDDELSETGVPRVTAFSDEMPGLVRRFRAGTKIWRKRLSKGDVDVVHINAMNGSTLAYASIAHRCGVPIRVVHSHNSDFGGGARLLKTALHKVGRNIWGTAANVRFACSNAAGNYLFGNSGFDFLPNGIDISRFSFDEGSRTRVRRALGIDDETMLIGSIGRLSAQKNPLFSVRVLADLVTSGFKSRLILVGDGILDQDVLSLAVELGVNDRYIHISSVDNPEVFYSALDVFLMPSVYEGFGFSLIEAQCNGLPCIVSEAIQKEAVVTNLVRMVRLSEGASAWARAACDTAVLKSDRHSYSSVVSNAGFSLESGAILLEEAYRHE